MCGFKRAILALELLNRVFYLSKIDSFFLSGGGGGPHRVKDKAI